MLSRKSKNLNLNEFGWEDNYYLKIDTTYLLVSYFINVIHIDMKNR
jgi:hypothetical protein